MDIQGRSSPSSFIYDQYTGNRYDGTGDVVLDLNSSRNIQEKRITQHWMEFFSIRFG